MKKILLLAAFVAGSFGMQAQGVDFGLKAGASFATLSGADNAENITSFHAGAALELNFVPVFSLQVEGLYSSQGAEYEDAFGAAQDFNLDYIAVPVMAKYYILPDRLSLMAGPQFSFLVDEAEEAWENEKFDLAAAGGVELKIIKGLFAQARYTIGLTEVNDTIEGKNAVFQLSLGYYFL